MDKCVTLSDEERKALAFADRIALPGYVERILAAREQTLRGEIAKEIEADLEAAPTGSTEALGWYRANRRAARIARGETR